MLESFISQFPKGDESGDFFTIDLGGSNLRILRVRLKKNEGLDDVKARKIAVTANSSPFPCIEFNFVHKNGRRIQVLTTKIYIFF